MVAEYVFVEEFYKELGGTGYPFTQIDPVVTDTGYSLSQGWMADASIYCDSLTVLPSLTEITRNGSSVGFTVGEYKGEYKFELEPADPTDHPAVELYSSTGLFGGILVLDREKILPLEAWKQGIHVPTKRLDFCARCLEVIPQQGLLRFKTDKGELLSGAVVLAGGQGTILEALQGESGVRYIRTNFVGDPTYAFRNPETDEDELKTPLQHLICTGVTDPSTGVKNSLILSPNALGGVTFVAQNVWQDVGETLQFSATNNSITISFGKKPK
jgi:hypothetical protein